VTEFTAIPHRLWELFSYNGKLAMYWGEKIGPDEPVREVYLRVSKSAADDYDILGQRPWSSGREWPTGVVRNARSGGQIFVAGESWSEQVLRIPIPAPRDGREYTWKWASGMREWQRDPYPRCATCGKYHKPGLAHCSWCEATITKPKLGIIFCPACIAAGYDKELAKE
jgi:hypothetical protein